MVALPFDDARIEELVLRFNAVMANEGSVISDLGGNASDDDVAVTLQETEGDLSRDEISEQQDALVALFWIGRGDAEPAEWEQTKTLARQQHERLASRYLLGQPLSARPAGGSGVSDGRSGEDAGTWRGMMRAPAPLNG